MKYILVVIVLAVICCQNEKRYESVILKISPAFENSSKFEINSKGDTSKMMFELYKQPKSVEEALTGDKILLKKEQISNPEIKSLFEAIGSFQDDDKRNEGLTDGVSVTIIKNFESSKDTTSIHVPLRERNPNHYNYLDKFFEVVEQTNSYSNQVYFESLKSYFDYGLPITLTNQDPKTYRIWGALSISEEADLNSLMKSISDNELVIFDFRNYQGIGSSLYQQFGQLNKRNSNVYYLYDKEMNRDMNAIGNERVLNSVSEIIESHKRGNR